MFSRGEPEGKHGVSGLAYGRSVTLLLRTFKIRYAMLRPTAYAHAHAAQY